MANITSTKRMTARPGDLTVGDLRGFIEGEDDSRKVSVNVDHPDRPGEMGQVSVTLTDASTTDAFGRPQRQVPQR